MSNELKAYCSSRKCADIRYENMSNFAVKDVKKTQVECPECGSILLWKRERSRNIVKDIVHKRNKPRNLRGEI